MTYGCEGFFDDEQEYVGPFDDIIERAIGTGSVHFRWSDERSDPMGDMKAFHESLQKVQEAYETQAQDYIITKIISGARGFGKSLQGLNPLLQYTDEATEHKVVDHTKPIVTQKTTDDSPVSAHVNVPAPTKLFYKRDNGELMEIGEVKDFNLCGIEFTDNDSDTNRD